jgi:hypothetical protein
MFESNHVSSPSSHRTGWSTGNAPNLYSGRLRFESRPRQWLSWTVFCFASLIQSRFLKCTSIRYLLLSKLNSLETAGRKITSHKSSPSTLYTESPGFITKAGDRLYCDLNTVTGMNILPNPLFSNHPLIQRY